MDGRGLDRWTVVRRRTGPLTWALPLVLASCGASGSIPSATSSPTTSAVKVAAQLAHAFIAPTGFTQDPDAVAKTGPIDLAKAASEESAHGGITAAILTSEGFVGGYQRIFHANDGGRLLVYLYQFGGARGANDYRGRQVASDRRVSGAGEFLVTSISNAVGLTGGSSSDPTAAIWLVKGDRAAFVAYDDQISRAQVETTALALAVEQYRRL